MTDSQWLLLVVSLVYLTDCMAWADLYSVGFSTWWGRRWRILRPGAIFANERGGLLLHAPLPPLGVSLHCRPWPVSLSPEAVLSYVTGACGLDRRPEQEEQLRCWDDIRRVEPFDKEVWLDGRPFARTDRPAQARWLADLIGRLAAAPAERREKLIESALEEAFDVESIHDRVASAREQSAVLAWMCNCLFAIVFVAAPLMVWAYGWLRTWRGLLLGLVVALAMTVWEYFRTHKSLFPDRSGERKLHAAIMCLNPLAAIRARDALTRDLLPASHPLAVAQYLCSREVFLELARRILLDARFPMGPWPPELDPEAVRTVEWFNTRLAAAVENCIRCADVDPAVLVRPEPPEEDSCLAYCPRCQTQFQRAEGTCSSCGGIRLLRLAGARETGAYYPGAGAL